MYVAILCTKSVTMHFSSLNGRLLTSVLCQQMQVQMHLLFCINVVCPSGLAGRQKPIIYLLVYRNACAFAYMYIQKHIHQK